MAFGMPRGPAGGDRDKGAQDALEAAVVAEKAASLGRAGRLVERRVGELHAFSGDAEERVKLVRAAAEAVHHYFVQRELCGLRNHAGPIEDYAIPKEVLARLGAR